MKKIFLTFFILLSIFTGLYAEKNDIALENMNNITFKDFSTFIINSINVPNSSHILNPVVVIVKNYPKLDCISTEKFLSYSDVAFITMQTLGLRGGIFYSILQNKRYAFKELMSLGIIPERTDPFTKITGTEAKRIFLDSARLLEGIIYDE